MSQAEVSHTKPSSTDDTVSGASDGDGAPSGTPGVAHSDSKPSRDVRVRRQLTSGDALRYAAHAGAWLAAAYIGYRLLTGDLGVNPIESLTHMTGRAALILLVASLACTPVNTVFGLRSALRARRALGLYAFGFAAAHLLVFVGVDYGFDLVLIRADSLAEKPYILVGAAALLILLPLALTSTRGWMRRLGRNWRTLHRLVYVAAVLVAVHYVWIGKVVTPGSAVAAGVVALLLILRVPRVRHEVARARRAATSA